MALVQAAAIGLIALVLAPGFSFHFDVIPKLIILLIAAALSSAGLRPASRSVLSLLVLLSILSLAISTALSATPDISTFGTNWRRYGAVAQAAVLLFAWLVSANAPRALPMLRVISTAGAFTAIYGIAQYFGWDPILPKQAYHVGEGIWTIVRPPSTLGYASYFATWLLFVIFLSLAIPGRIWKAISAVCTIAMVLTGTRAAILGLAVGLAVWLFWRGSRVSRRAIVAAAAVLIAGAIFYYSPPGWQMRSRTRWFVEDPWGGARPLLWRDTVRMAAAHPLFGYGPETFYAAFPQFQSADLERAYPDFAHESPHNIFLDALVSQGALGLLILTAFCAFAFRAAWRARDRDPSLAPALAAALAAGLASQQFTVLVIPTAVIFFTTIALAVGLDAPPSPHRRSWIAIAAAVPLLYVAIRFALADHALALAQRSLDAGDLAGAARHYAAARIPGASSDLWYSRRLINAGALQPALVAGVRATTTAEDPFDSWYSLSSIHAAMGNAAAAEQSLRNAIRASPNWFKPHWTLARLLALTGRLPEAQREAAIALELDGGKHPEVTQTLQAILPGLQK
jgi:O-antigen ligase